MSKKHDSKAIRALQGRPGAEYDQETFLHLLSIEQARAERANQRVRLLLATLEPVPGKPVEIPPSTAVKLFEALRVLLRDTDFMGWYRQSYVAGAVLSSTANGADYETSALIEQRVRDGLRKHLPAKTAGSLRARVTQHGPRRIVKR